MNALKLAAALAVFVDLRIAEHFDLSRKHRRLQRHGLSQTWTASTKTVVIVGAENQAIISPFGSQQYFRLK